MAKNENHPLNERERPWHKNELVRLGGDFLLFDADDLFVQRRAVKAHKLKHERAGTLQGLSLFVFGASEEGTDNALLQAFLPENLQTLEGEQAVQLRCLFLTLKFPGGASFTAQAQLKTPGPVLLFRTFFPSDTGPLPRVGNFPSSSQQTLSDPHPIGSTSQELGQDRTEGFDLLVPFDVAKLQTIWAQFLFLASPGG